MVKQFSTVRDTQRDSQSYVEKRGGRREIEVTRRRKGESKVFWCSQVLDLSLLPLAFTLIFTVASRLLHPYIPDDKTSRLMVKRFSTVRDTQRGSQSYMEKRRRRREIEVTRRRRWGVKRRETNLTSNQFPKCSPPEKAMAPHSSTLAWKIPWTEELGRLQFMGLLRVTYD